MLARAAPGGVGVEPAFELLDEGLGVRIDPSRPAMVRAYLPAADRSAALTALEEVRTRLGHLRAFGLRPIGELQVRLVDEADWADAWKRHFPVLRIGRSLVVRPSWRRYRAREGEVVVILDPGMAFGTGLHPTTRLCLAALERWAQEGTLAGRRVLDLGSGSGILALAAGKLGAEAVLALDTDPVAVQATEANTRRNGLSRVIRAQRGSLPSPEGPFDLVLANLIASLLVALAPQLRASVRTGGRTPGSGGRLLCSGIVRDREPEVQRALAAAGFRVTARSGEADWVALEAERLG
ncbi:MAG: 50S ribosomal protein L11 methyltransferase [Chloroflexota bacterium]|nr:50S ribosomal protein L11 methyltransferase [Chloroflexota bacterium]